MPLPLCDTSPAYALGLLADISREQALLAASQAQPSATADAELDAAVAKHSQHRAELASIRQAVGQLARQLAEHNGAQAERMPKLAKLQQRAQGLAAAQAATADPVAARALRRSRAELMVQVEDVSRDLAQAQSLAATARDELANLHGQLTSARATLGAAQRQLDSCHRQRPRLQAHLRALTLRQMAAHATWRAGLGSPGAALQAWSLALEEVAAASCRLHEQMRVGRFAQGDVEKAAGGRAPLTGEVIWGRIALGDLQGARHTFAELCGTHGFLHHIFQVYRAFCGGLMVAQDSGPLAEVLRLHRRSQGLRGSLADCLWALMHRDEAGYAQALPQVVHLDALTWQRSETPALGLVSLLGCSLLRLGHRRGFAAATALAPTLGPTVPPGPWSVAKDAKLS